MVPIWFTFSRRALQAFLEIAVEILFWLVTKRSSPTIWWSLPREVVRLV